MDDLPNLPLKWIPLLAAAFAIVGLVEVVPMPEWLGFGLGFMAAGILAVAAAIHWFNLIRGRPSA